MMNNISIIDKCFGCRSCEQICPTNAISMVPDKNGFIHPIVDNDKCIDCGICLAHCPAKTLPILKEPKSFNAFINKDRTELLKSSSGGFAYALASHILRNGGVVFGSVFNEDLVVEQEMIDNIEDLAKTRGSKYVQSDTKDTFKLAKEKLDKGILVLYVGTPCQIAGLKKYIVNEYQNLVTVDFICHGVPSPKLFSAYVKDLEEKMGDKIINYSFRDKKNGWGNFLVSASTNKKTYRKIMIADKYGDDFFSMSAFRDCCYSCPFSQLDRVSDFTMGDLWGVEETNLKARIEDGVSVILVNSDKALDILKDINGLGIISQCDKNIVIKHQENLSHPSTNKKPGFYDNIDFENYYKNKKVKLSLKARIKSLIPGKIKNKLKRLLSRRGQKQQ
ncbi:MAG: Coenzyme F420 hydrogenase/dehydrogenase, beta subunit C-terminal domain [Erysipelotrichaceae bacterium]|nr:Coenzyme F420 hydrogenase/dehydrogenase, beta subunit C-terminal domain [Erysipelotrichaceae bacterium]